MSAPGRSLQADHPIGAVRDAILARHSVLATPQGRTDLSVHALAFHESEVMIAAMALLSRRGIASLPVHDCLIVPVSALQVAQDALRDAFASHL